MISSSESSEARCGKSSGSTGPLAVEISHQKFVVSVGAEISRGHRIDAGAAAAFHVRRVPQDRDLVIFAFDRQIASSLLKQRPRPRPRGGNDDWETQSFRGR